VRNKLTFDHEWRSRGPFPSLRIAGRKNLELAFSSGRGAICAAPHVGQYHRIPLAIIDLDLPVTLLVDERNYEIETKSWDAWMQDYRGRTLAKPITYINAEHSTAAWQMAKSLREGRILIVYLDGNSGLPNSGLPKAVTEVTFCGLRLQVRKGLAYLSAHSMSPIIPVVAWRSGQGGDTVRFEQPCQITGDETTEAYCARAMQYCYDVLERCVRCCMSSWEEWYHLNRWVIYQGNHSGGSLFGSHDPQNILQFIVQTQTESSELIELENGPVLVNLDTGTAIAATEYVAAFLGYAMERITGEKLLEQLRGLANERQLRSSLLELLSGGFLGIVDCEFAPVTQSAVELK
jgi:lauroyl/myristoyl acyltransferase